MTEDPAAGLTRTQVDTLRQQHGWNELPAENGRHLWRTIRGIVFEPMFAVLLLACGLYLVLGELDQGLLMLAGMIFVAAISFFQDVKSNHALQALRQYTEPRIGVIREGAVQSILSRELVPGDLMILEEGNLVPADGVVVQSNDLSVNESVLTGESVPVDKNAADGDSRLFQGGTVNSGRGLVRATATGATTQLGKLGKSLSVITTSKTLLQQQIGRFVTIMAWIGGGVFLILLLVNYGHTRDILRSVLVGLTLAMAIIPEEIPVAFSSFMALGAWRMAKLGIITRQPVTIENLGAVSVICLDKTGTITENRMRVAATYDHASRQLLQQSGSPGQAQDLLYLARLASEKEPFDAMEKAIVEASPDAARDATYPLLIHEYALGGRPPMMTHVYQTGDGILVTGKGAPERIFAACRLAGEEEDRVAAVASKMAADGYRVLGICKASPAQGSFPAAQDDFPWQFAGLVALFDPPRKAIREEFERWHKAGIQIRLVTGDYAETARNIAAQVGIAAAGDTVTGDEVMGSTEAGLKQLATDRTLFVRMFPEAKLKLIDALKSNGEIVAMIGDGVNDGPALRSAHIGIAMGQRGTELAREAAALILTDDDPSKVTEAIAQGRKIYHNLKKALRYIISIHVPIILTATLPVLLNWKYPNVFSPVHVIFLELIMGPTCSVFFENEPVEPLLMSRPPRPRRNNIITLRELMISLSQGIIIAGGILLLYHHYMREGYTLAYVRTVVFFTIVIANVFLTLVNRSFEESIFRTIRYRNRLAPIALAASLFFLASLAFIPPVREAFGLLPLRAVDYTLAAGVGVASALWLELLKWLSRIT